MTVLERQEEISTLIWRLPGHICVLDSSGNIIAVNEAWLRFARENGLLAPASILPGSNYLVVCQAAGEAGDTDAAAVLEGLRGILEGRLSGFRYEYPCNGPSVERWFLLEASPLSGKEGGAVLCHTDTTVPHRVKSQLGQEAGRGAGSLTCMCSSCKRVRQTSTHWQEIEEYIDASFGERFSHSLCPECAERLYPEISDSLPGLEP